MQVLFKENWRFYNFGGGWLEYVVDRSGEEILEPAVLEEIEPNKTYYMQQQKKNEFHPTVFHPSVTWSTIEELHKTGRIWRLKQ